MYIHPDSNINILKNCPLDPTYDHTLWFDDATKQQDYFASIAKFKLTEQSYQRVQRGVMRVKIKAEDLYDCNYLMFQNTAFGSKWFYAFIKSVEYVNNITSEITFEIDVLQTWFFDYSMGQCFVEREHPVIDTVGANTVPEDLEQGPYVEVSAGQFVPDNWKPTRIMMLTTFWDTTLEPYPGEMINGVFTGLCPSFYDTVADLKLKINEIITQNKIEGVTALYMCPLGPLGTYNTFDISKNYKIDGYTPKNAKLFTYPYNVLHVYNGQESMDLHYELFGGSRCEFHLEGVVVPEPIIQLIPLNYSGATDNPTLATTDLERRIAVTHFPQCTFNSDVYRTYLAEYAARIPVENAQAQLGVASAAASIVPAIMSGSVSGMISAGTGLASSVLQVQSINARREDISTKPPELRGVANPNANWAMGNLLFRYKKLTIKAEYARIIDEYFTMYGYATHRVKIPNRDSRPHWNYVKTIGCVLRGSVPADDVTKICSIYNNGITFWKNPDEVGDYSLDNRPSGVG